MLGENVVSCAALCLFYNFVVERKGAIKNEMIRYRYISEMWMKCKFLLAVPRRSVVGL